MKVRIIYLLLALPLIAILTGCPGTSSSPPIAHISAVSIASVGDTVELNGSGSSADYGLDSFSWSIVSRPQGAPSVQIENPTDQVAYITPTLNGLWQVRLTVTDEFGLADSAEHSITVIGGNEAPVAQIEAPTSVTLGEEVFLDGSGSSDDDGIVSFAWEITDFPADAPLVSVIDDDQEVASFTPTATGEWTVSLTVEDADGESGTAEATIAVGIGAVPIPDAGESRSVEYGEVLLDGTGSDDPDGMITDFAWTFESVPVGSYLGDDDLIDRFTDTATFNPDLLGSYELRLTVTDNLGNTASDIVVITVYTDVPLSPVSDPGEEVVSRFEDVALLDGSMSYDPDGIVTDYSWVFASTPFGSESQSADIVDADTAFASFTPDKTGTYRVRLTVYDDDGRAASSIVQVRIIRTEADAGSDQHVLLGETAYLYAGNSAGTNLEYAWSFAYVPAESDLWSGDMSDRYEESASFAPDVPGLFGIELVVVDELGYEYFDDVVYEVTSPYAEDAFEDDDYYADATVLVQETPQEHSIHTFRDNDWFSFAAVGDEIYTIQTSIVGDEEIDTVLTLYDLDVFMNTVVLAENDDNPWNDGSVMSRIDWECPTDGTFYISVEAIDELGLYQIELTTGSGTVIIDLE